MKIDTVHRITGRHLLVNEHGAGIWLSRIRQPEVSLPMVGKLVDQGLGWLGWPGKHRLHHYRRGAAIIIDAPVDLLYTACELLEWAVRSVREERQNVIVDDSFEVVLKEHREENIRWRVLRARARAANIPVFDDEDGLTLGMGCNSITWSLTQLPERIDAEDYQRIPACYITGTNGKTTTARLLSLIARSAGFVDGLTSSDGVMVEGTWITRGDWTGTGAARKILRHPRVDFAILETARGGLMRRGLVIDDVEAALITNISDDHLGQWGLNSLEEMAVAKLTVALGIRADGVLVLNADCPVLSSVAPDWCAEHTPDVELHWFGLEQNDLPLTVWTEEGVIYHRQAGAVCAIEDVPITLKGLAVHNTSNALAAVSLAAAMRIEKSAIVDGIQRMAPSRECSNGRANWYHYNGADVILDFAHNPDGVLSMVEVGNRWGAERCHILLGQAGDRNDSLLKSLSNKASKLHNGLFYLKPLPEHAHGRDPSEVVDVIESSLKESGVAASMIKRFEHEVEAAKHALRSCEEGDLLLLLVHENLELIQDELEFLGAVPASLSHTSSAK